MRAGRDPPDLKDAFAERYTGPGIDITWTDVGISWDLTALFEPLLHPLHPLPDGSDESGGGWASTDSGDEPVVRPQWRIDQARQLNSDYPGLYGYGLHPAMV